jgi:hypothetical protein
MIEYRGRRDVGFESDDSQDKSPSPLSPSRQYTSTHIHGSTRVTARNPQGTRWSRSAPRVHGTRFSPRRHSRR